MTTVSPLVGLLQALRSCTVSVTMFPVYHALGLCCIEEQKRQTENASVTTFHRSISAPASIEKRRLRCSQLAPRCSIVFLLLFLLRIAPCFSLVWQRVGSSAGPNWVISSSSTAPVRLSSPDLNRYSTQSKSLSSLPDISPTVFRPEPAEPMSFLHETRASQAFLAGRRLGFTSAFPRTTQAFAFSYSPRCMRTSLEAVNERESRIASSRLRVSSAACYERPFVSETVSLSHESPLRLLCFLTPPSFSTAYDGVSNGIEEVAARLWAHKKGAASTRNGRDSNPKFLGLKKAGGQKVLKGQIIARQRGTKWHEGRGVGRGGDDTLFATRTGIVRFEGRRVAVDELGNDGRRRSSASCLQSGSKIASRYDGSGTGCRCSLPSDSARAAPETVPRFSPVVVTGGKAESSLLSVLSEVWMSRRRHSSSSSS